MSDDLFSQLFNLFNNDDGDVNWQLAEQINNHINKDIQEDRLLSNSDLNYQEIFRVIELSQESEVKNEYAPLEILIMDQKKYGVWFLNSVRHFDFSELQMFEGLPPGIGGAQSSLLGMHLGNIAGFKQEHLGT